jgi:hypothetical protein
MVFVAGFLIGCTELPFGSWDNPNDADGSAPGVQSVVLDKTDLSLTSNAGILTASIRPTTAINQKLIWNSSDPSIATVGANGMIVGQATDTKTVTVTAKKDGTATITATSADGNKVGSCIVAVTGTSVTTVVLPEHLDIATSGNAANTGKGQLSAVVSPESAINKSIIWLSDNTAVATVSDSGQIIPTGPVGTVHITATSLDSGVVGTCTVTVRYYQVGDLGPAGGIVFYDDGNQQSWGRWLEAAPSDQSNGLRWNNGQDVVITTATAIGTGKANTDAIISAQGNPTGNNYAANLCKNQSIGGKTDWFLPSKNELNIMYTKLHLLGLGGFYAGNYWSSSQSIE